jgi:hypothetical protein
MRLKGSALLHVLFGMVPTVMSPKNFFEYRSALPNNPASVMYSSDGSTTADPRAERQLG